MPIDILADQRKSYWRNIFCCCLKKKNKSFDLDKLKFKKAPEPTDVFWEHLSVPKSKKRWRIFYTYIFTFVLIGISLGIIYGLTKAKHQQN
jgi:hypothetical protein